MNDLIIEGLVKKEIPLLIDGKLEKTEMGFFFGTLTFKLMKVNHGIDLQDIDSKKEEIEKDPFSGMDFVVDFVHTAHASWQKINGKEPLVNQDQLLFAMDVMGVDKFSEIMNEGLKQFEEKEGNPKTPSSKE